ncbi:hypothetical protein SMACR_07674 [Sordaria macrospora]|uniref:WGS project CABT00000000 data, contig 2.27 n=2 Tax=Sordaria macrospora TaxID=5147 RepID=F7W4H5_SORMK|nr:uncharacterized protein SMAC_07674 [Sordaria macrospora k-hell]KAA8634863.1 hypothetical protein SMACR_07674 [Sordaria macrospora]KAH7635494.1 hypothetical protein B0T09DRAFT_23891 [Sordaria sp. MPI-SDFR-AT-0083]WPJ67426.1 hypothetical protein SMAC4_07674 [Sordaria macrospora]CCC14928.1 unnamed protein product [Sordaria macrospora k-hell]
MPRVPTIRQVIPDAGVNIVLKADQPTGRTVSGYIQDVLTKGNHPRGIKVRLTDGRVGRVQSMNSNPDSGSADMESFNATFDSPTRQPHHRGGSRPDRYGAGHPQPPPTQQFGLDAYIKPAKTKRGGGHGGGFGHGQGHRQGGSTTLSDPLPSTVDAEPEEESVCPVCADFRGDAPAVAHHVAAHFGE